MEGVNHEFEDLVIDMTLSDDEGSTEKQPENTTTDDKPSLEVPETVADVPTELAASTTARESSSVQNSTEEPPPEKDPLETPVQSSPAIKDPSILSILGNYAPSELSKVTTQAMIECISRFPALWDSQEPNNYNQKYCSLLWKNIAVVLNMNVKKAKAKWYALRRAFRKEYSKSKATGISSRFIYYQALSFLEPETIRENERELKKSKLEDIINRTKSIPNGNATVDDDDCMIVEDLEDCSDNSTLNATDPLAVTSALDSLKNGEKGDLDTRLGESIANSDEQNSDIQQPRPPLIRAKNISELLATPPSIPPEPVIQRDNREPSPEVIFLSKKAVPAPIMSQIIITDAFPALDKNETKCDKQNLREMRQTTPRVESHRKSTENKTEDEKSNRMSNGNSRNDSAAQRFPKEPQSLSKSGNPVPKKPSPLKEPPHQPKKQNEDKLGKRINESTPIGSKSAKKRKKSHSESKGESNKILDSQDCTEMNKAFLTSLLPDVERMTNSQFRTFKKQATHLVSMILDK